MHPARANRRAVDGRPPSHRLLLDRELDAPCRERQARALLRAFQAKHDALRVLQDQVVLTFVEGEARLTGGVDTTEIVDVLQVEDVARQP